MAQPGNFTPILLYGSSTPGNVPLAANLTNSATGSEIAINVADKNLFFKDSGGTVNTVPIRQSSTSSNGWLSATDWNTFNNKSNTNGTVTSVAALTLGTTGTDLSSTVANGTTTPVITLNVPTASAANRGALSAADWSTFNGKQAALVSGTNIKTVGGVSLLGSGDVGTIGVGYGGTGLTSLTANYIPYGNGTSAFASSSNLTFDGSNFFLLGTGSLNVGTSAGAGKLTVVASATQPCASFDAPTSGYAYLALKYATAVYGYIGQASAVIGGGSNTDLAIRAENNLLFLHGGAEVARIFASGGVSIGNTTDPGATNLSVTGSVKAAKFYTGTGTTASTANATPVTMFAVASEGAYIVSAYIFGTAAPATYTAVAIVKSSGGVAAVTAISPATNLSISVSGLNVQVTQLSGGSQSMDFNYTRLY